MQFTFYYIYINTAYCLCSLHILYNLHSTIFILIRNTFVTNLRKFEQFTFYYIYINTENTKHDVFVRFAFTFYYIYINTN